MAQIQPPTLTLDPKLINFYAEVLHLCIETFGSPHICNSGKGHQLPLFGWGMVDLTKGLRDAEGTKECVQSKIRSLGRKIMPLDHSPGKITQGTNRV